MATPLQTVARPKQGRSERTLYRILDAAEALIAEKGLADASIPEIVRRAGSSVGGFYARFRDKNELLRALEERFFVEVGQRLERLAALGRAPGSDLHDVIAASIEELVSIARARRNLLCAFVARSLHDEAFKQDAMRFRHEVSDRVAQLVAPWHASIRHPDPPLAVEMAVQFALAFMLHRVVIADVSEGRALTDADIARELRCNVLRYLGVEVA